jgi:hypothetical protein
VTKPFLAATIALALGSCAMGVSGPKGNDTGGIIPWSPENERAWLAIAQSNCGAYNKYAVYRSARRVYGDYITYECRFDPPVRAYFRRQVTVRTKG